MSRKIKTIPVNAEDVGFIFSEEPESFTFLTSHCYCKRCKNNYNSSIINYTIKLNSLYDIELDGYALYGLSAEEGVVERR